MKCFGQTKKPFILSIKDEEHYLRGTTFVRQHLTMLTSVNAELLYFPLFLHSTPLTEATGEGLLSHRTDAINRSLQSLRVISSRSVRVLLHRDSHVSFPPITHSLDGTEPVTCPVVAFAELFACTLRFITWWRANVKGFGRQFVKVAGVINHASTRLNQSW